MPWKECSVMDERMQFVARRLTGEPMSELRREFGIFNFSKVFAGQAVGIKEVHDNIWLVSFMDYDLGYFDLETRVLEPLDSRGSGRA
jgi:hypothetical protein